jgi:hypothetical protein
LTFTSRTVGSVSDMLWTTRSISEPPHVQTGSRREKIIHPIRGKQ